MRLVAGLLIALLGTVSQSSARGEEDEILTQLSKIRPDKNQIRSVRDITIRRDVLTISLNRGVLAFFEPIKDKITGAVFIGSGEIVAIPPDSIEKQQVYKFTGTPVLNEAFQTAIFRFTDSTGDEIKSEIAQHAEEDVSADDAAQFDSLNDVLAADATALNLRIMSDLLESGGRPLFFGALKGDKTGWFNILFDQRATEEVSVFQLHDIGNTAVPDVWASFNQRSEARNPEAVAHENKSAVEIVSYDIDGSTSVDNKIDAKVDVHLRARTNGARVLNFEISPTLKIASILLDNDESVSFYQYPQTTSVTAVLPRGLKTDQALTLRFAYSGELGGRGPQYPSQQQQTIPSFKSSFALPDDRSNPVFEYSGRRIVPASYHDQWLTESLTHYLATMSAEANDPDGTQMRKLLSDSREELKPVESAGPIWLGQRLVSTVTPNAYGAVHGKGIWVIHMLRMLLRENASKADTKFLALLQEFADTYGGKAASTWDFKHLAEKHAGQKLDWFFDQWVFATGVPSYKVDYKIEAAAGQFTIAGKITQAGVPDGFIMPVPIYADGEYLGTVEVGDVEGQFSFRVDKRPEQLVIDPEMTTLRAAAQ